MSEHLTTTEERVANIRASALVVAAALIALSIVGATAIVAITLALVLV